MFFEINWPWICAMLKVPLQNHQLSFSSPSCSSVVKAGCHSKNGIKTITICTKVMP